MKKRVLVHSLSALLLCMATPALSSETPAGPVAKICANCHTAEPGVMMGFLESIALKSKTLQMDFLGPKEVVKFDDNTAVKNVASLKDIKNYLSKGFSVTYEVRNGENFATEINRFDILKTIESGTYKVEKLDKTGFKALAAQANTHIYDVRPPMKYKEAHIPQAKPLPATAFDKFKGTLPEEKTTPIVVYGVGGCLSPTVAFNLKSMGYENVSIYTGGFPDWSKSESSVVAADWLSQAIDKEIPHVLIDLRDNTEVTAGHIKGATSIVYDKLIASKTAFPKQKNAPIIMYGGTDNQAAAANTLLSWGYRAVRILPVSFEEWKSAGLPTQTGAASTTITYVPKAKAGTISIDEFENLVDHPQTDTLLVDVRNPDEFSTAHIPDSVNIPVDQLSHRLSELPTDKSFVLFCPTGTRAEMAQNILEKSERKSRFLDANLAIDTDGTIEVGEK